GARGPARRATIFASRTAPAAVSGCSAPGSIARPASRAGSCTACSGDAMRYGVFAVAASFSFLRGASHPEELVAAAARVGLSGLGLCDRSSVAGVVRAHVAKRESGLQLCYPPGARVVFADGTPDILAYPRDRPGWGRLCRLLTLGNGRADKGDCILRLPDLLDHADGLELVVMEKTTAGKAPLPLGEGRAAARERAVVVGTAFGKAAHSPLPARFARHPLPQPAKRPEAGEGKKPGTVVPFTPTPLPNPPPQSAKRPKGGRELLALLREAAPARVRLAATMLYRGQDRARLGQRAALARQIGVPLLAVNDVLYHAPQRRPLQDVLTCIREHVTLDAAGRLLAANAERHLKTPGEMARLFCDAPAAIEETLSLSQQLTFSLDELAYNYPDETREGFGSPQDA